MTEKIFALFVLNVFTANFILFRFLGMCPFIGVSKERKSAFWMSMAVIFVMVISSVITWVLYNYVLVPMGLNYMRTVTFILVIATAVQMIDMIMLKTLPALHKTLGIYLPLITTNCAVLGVAVLNIDMFAGKTTAFNGFIFSVFQGLFAGLGFMLAIMLMSGIRERLDLADIPNAMKGIPIAFLIAALMSMAFMGFNGLGI